MCKSLHPLRNNPGETCDLLTWNMLQPYLNWFDWLSISSNVFHVLSPSSSSPLLLNDEDKQLHHKTRDFQNVFVLFAKHLSGCFQDLLGDTHQCVLRSSPKGKNFILHLRLFKTWCVKITHMLYFSYDPLTFRILDFYQKCIWTRSFSTHKLHSSCHHHL